jgi:hypothetical protein
MAGGRSGAAYAGDQQAAIDIRECAQVVGGLDASNI